MTILHLALAGDWAEAEKTGEYLVSTRGRTLAEEGFIHACADLRQLHGVAERFYADVTDPMLVLTVDEALLDCPVLMEVPPGVDEEFPHIYGPLPVPAVVSVTPFTR